MPWLGRKQHGMTRTGEGHHLDIATVSGQTLGELRSAARVSDAVGSSVREKQRSIAQRRKGLVARQPGCQCGHAAHPTALYALPMIHRSVIPAVVSTMINAVSALENVRVIGHPKRHPATHGVPDQTDRQVAESLGDLVKGPTSIWQRRLRRAVPPAHGEPKSCQRDSAATRANDAATKGNHAQDSRVEGPGSLEAVRRASMQKQHNRLRTCVITAEAQMGLPVHRTQI